MARRKTWSDNAGTRGQRNWVRAFEKAGKFYLEWLEPVFQTNREGEHVRVRRLDPKTGKAKLVYRRPRKLLKGVTARHEARHRMKLLSRQFEEIEAIQGPQAALSTARLVHLYLKEKTPRKGQSKQAHDHAAAKVWLSFFNSQTEVARRSQRHPSTLDRVDWDRFIEARRYGRIPGWPRQVRNRTIAYDLKFLISALRWGTGLGEGDQAHLKVNPWNADRRSAKGMVMPKERKKLRPGMPPDVRVLLIGHSPSWQFTAALELGRETRRRNNTIRQLLWSDVDLKRCEVSWRGEIDKSGWENVTPLTDLAVEVLRGLPVRGVGPVPVFPSATDPGKPTSRHTMQVWLQRAKKRVLNSLPPEERPAMARRLKGVGFHSEKRSGVRDPWFRSLPPKIQEEMAGTRWSTLRDHYDDVSADDIREAWTKQSSG